MPQIDEFRARVIRTKGKSMTPNNVCKFYSQNAFIFPARVNSIQINYKLNHTDRSIGQARNRTYDVPQDTDHVTTP